MVMIFLIYLFFLNFVLRRVHFKHCRKNPNGEVRNYNAAIGTSSQSKQNSKSDCISFNFFIIKKITKSSNQIKQKPLNTRVSCLPGKSSSAPDWIEPSSPLALKPDFQVQGFFREINKTETRGQSSGFWAEAEENDRRSAILLIRFFIFNNYYYIIYKN